jgi:amino acid efflux transporter
MAMGQPDGRLHRSLNITQATGIAVTLVVGAGALMLPGLAYVEVGDAAVYAWIGDALLVIPLLVTFSYLARLIPTAVGVSFLVVLVLYVTTAVSLQLAVSRDDPGLAQAPIAVLAASFAGATSGRFVAALGFLIIVASFTSVMWAASRLIFATAREGFLPPVFRHIDATTGAPRPAVVLTAGLFGVVTLLNATNLFSINLLYGLAGQGLFVVYGLCVVAFVRLTHRWPARAFGIVTLVPVVAVTASFGYGVLYALGVMVLGIIWKGVHTYRNRRTLSPLPS